MRDDQVEHGLEHAVESDITLKEKEVLHAIDKSAKRTSPGSDGLHI